MEALRQVPPINDILRSPELTKFRGILGRPFVARLLETVLRETRQEILRNNSPVSRPELTARIAAELSARISAALRPSIRRVINASGVVLHTNLGRAPLPAAALEHLREVSAGYSNLEYDAVSGSRGNRGAHVESLIEHLLGCEAAAIANNNAAAVLLILNTFAEAAEVIVSRGELVEIGGSFRIPDVMARSGARLREVGTTNRTRIADYESAITEHTRLLLRVHPSNFQMIGFTERPSVEEFAALGHRLGIPTCEDLGSGCILEAQDFGISGEPMVGDSLTAGVDVVCFSGDKLFGGPQAGIVAGKKPCLERMRRNPLFRALRVDKLTLSVLESVLISYASGRTEEIPVWRMLGTTVQELKSRAEAFARRAEGRAIPLELMSVVGGGSAPQSSLESWGVTLQINGFSSAQLEKRLRESDPPVVGRIEKDRVVLDLRTVAVDEEETLLALIKGYSP